MRRATEVRGTSFVPKQVLYPKLSAQETSRRFSVIIGGYTAKQLADAADSSVEAAKEWIAGTRAPSAAKLINMARTLPCVLRWINEEAQAGHRAAMARSDDSVVHALRKLKDAAGPEGDAVRAILRELGEGRSR